MKNSIKYFLSAAIFLTVLTGCLPDPEDIKETCQVLREAGIEKNFGITADEKRVMTRRHKEIISNIIVWYRKNCP